jgi:glutaredoxin
MNRFLTILFIAVCAHLGWKYFIRPDASVDSNTASATEMTTLAASIKVGDVIMYSTTECTYCAQAKAWLNQNNFIFTECNMSVDSHCESEFKSYGGNGTPYLVVRNHHMKNGFDSDEFVAALRNHSGR